MFSRHSDKISQVVNANPTEVLANNNMDLVNHFSSSPCIANESAAQLVVGKGLLVKGTVEYAEKVIVIGEAEINMNKVSHLLIGSTGILTGNVEAINADIEGTFRGKLRVLGLLKVRKGAVIDGEVFYQEIEVERGSKIIGQMSKDENVLNYNPDE